MTFNVKKLAVYLITLTLMLVSFQHAESADQKPTWTYKSFILSNDVPLHYAVVLPDNYDYKKEYPVLIVFSSQTQTAELINQGLRDYWGDQSKPHGFVVISPVMPQGGFEQGTLLPEMFTNLKYRHRPKNGKFHLAGNSFGGLTCFKVALKHPEFIESITVLAGFTPYFDQLDKIKHIPVNLFVGERDYIWQRPMRIMKDRLITLGGTVTWNVITENDHDLISLQNNPVIFQAIKPFAR